MTIFVSIIRKNMNREIVRIALPNIISNITVPLMGIISTAIAGHLGGDSAVMIGELAIGASIFNFIYWNSSFIRMGSSGLTAQAYGRGDFRETSRMFVRSISIALLLGLLLLIFKEPLAFWSVKLMNGDSVALEYVRARLWAVPAGVILFAFHGWFTGMQNATIPMSVAILVNVTHIAVSFLLAIHLDMGIVGIAYASVVAQWVGVATSVILLLIFYRKSLQLNVLDGIFESKAIREFFGVNRDIIIRTFCNVCVYVFFTASSARMGDKNILAVNTLLMELFTLFSYMTDGFAYAAEALTGRFVGAKDVASLRKCIKICMYWSIFIAVGFVVAYMIGWRDILSLFVSDDGGDAIIAMAGEYIGWIIFVPLSCALPFLLDGVMVGATMTYVMRDSMILSMIAFFVIYFTLSPFIGNNALWLAFLLFFIVRGGLQYFFTDRLQTIYTKAK